MTQTLGSPGDLTKVAAFVNALHELELEHGVQLASGVGLSIKRQPHYPGTDPGKGDRVVREGVITGKLRGTVYNSSRAGVDVKWDDGRAEDFIHTSKLRVIVEQPANERYGFIRDDDSGELVVVFVDSTLRSE